MFCFQGCEHANITINSFSIASIVLSGEWSGRNASILCEEDSICSIECLGQNACDGMTVYCIGAQCDVECSMDTECSLVTSSQPTPTPTFMPTDATSNLTSQMTLNPTSDQSAGSSQFSTITPTEASESDEEATPNAKGEASLDLMVVMSAGAILFVCSLCVLYYTMRRQKNNKKVSENEGIVGAMAIENIVEIDSCNKKKESSSDHEAANVELVAMMVEHGDSLYNLNDNEENGTENGPTHDSKFVKDGEGFNG